MTKRYGDVERARHHLDSAWSTCKLEAELGRLEARVDARKRGPLSSMLVVALAGTCAVAAFLVLDAPVPVAESAATLSRVEQTPTTPAHIAPRAMGTEPVVAAADANRAEPQARSSPGQSDAVPHEGSERTDSAVRRQSARVKVAGAAWRSLARQGRYQEAYHALRGVEPDRVRAEVDELLLAGDAARLSGHAREAVPYYRAALDKAGKDPRAHLAAFTLGRTLLNELHDPRAAADAFARAYKAAPHGPLAEETLAREAESWQRAGDAARAKAAIERYRAAYPEGRLIRR